MKRYVREFANDFKSLFTPLANPELRKSYEQEIDRIVAACKAGKISSFEAIKAMSKLKI